MDVMKFLLAASLLILFGLVRPAFAADSGNPDPYYTVSDIEVFPKKIPVPPHIDTERTPTLGPSPFLIINLAAIAWDVISGTKPAINSTSAFATAVPETVESWTELDEWRGPRTHRFQVNGTNILGLKVASATYVISYLYHGQTDEGGQYLTNVKVLPEEVNVVSGFHINVDARVSPPFNVGSEEKPVGGLELLLTHQIGSFIKTKSYTRSFQISGDGYLAETTEDMNSRSYLFRSDTD